MRKIFYVPKSKDYMDYESEWKGVTGHIQTGISDNIKDFVDNPDVAQMVLIPEFLDRKAANRTGTGGWGHSRIIPASFLDDPHVKGVLINKGL